MVVKERGLVVRSVGGAELSLVLPTLRRGLGLDGDSSGIRSPEVAAALVNRVSRGKWYEVDGVRFMGLKSTPEGSQRMVLAIRQNSNELGGRVYGGAFFPGGRSISFVGCDPIDYFVSLKNLPGFSWPIMFDAFEGDMGRVEWADTAARRGVMGLWSQTVRQFSTAETLYRKDLPVVLAVVGDGSEHLGRVFDELVLGGKAMDLRWSRIGVEFREMWKNLEWEIGKVGRSRGQWLNWLQNTD